MQKCGLRHAIDKIKAPSGLSKVNRMMHRIFASRADSALVSLALSWTVTAKAEKAGLLACAAMLSGFFPFLLYNIKQ